jgi:hypothetical protein
MDRLDNPCRKGKKNDPQIANSDTGVPSLERFYFALFPNGAICLRFPQADS